MNIITPPEIDRLALGMGPRYRAFPVFACYSGLRVSECFGLKWRNVHFTDSYVEVATNQDLETDGAVLTGQPTKSSAGRRNVPAIGQSQGCPSRAQGTVQVADLTIMSSGRRRVGRSAWQISATVIGIGQ